MKRLTDDEITAWLEQHTNWRRDNDTLCCSLRFESFNAAWGFLSRVALHAERLNHHPEWCNVYDRVEIVLTTHDADGITAKDFELAECMDQALSG